MKIGDAPFQFAPFFMWSGKKIVIRKEVWARQPTFAVLLKISKNEGVIF